MRKYSKRTKSTARKTYQDYLEARAQLEAKGIELNTIMTKKSFEAVYDRYLEAKKAGEIKSQAWQHLLSKERLISKAQAKNFAIAQTEKNKEAAIVELDKIKDSLSDKEYQKKLNKISKMKTTMKEVYTFDIDKIRELGAYITETKETGLYGGKYE